MRWRRVRDTPYEVSDRGGVRRVLSRAGSWLNPPRQLRPYLAGEGYPAVLFHFDGQKRQVFVHNLVADTFLAAPRQGRQVNHKDGDKTNNRYGNLEYVTGTENQLHAYNLGLQTGPCLSSNDVKKIRRRLRRGDRVREIADAFSVTMTTVYNIKNSRHH